MNEILLTLFSLGLIYLFTVQYFLPKRKMEAIAAKFRAKGYRVYIYPFRPFLSAFFTQVAKDVAKGDAQKLLKEQLSDYDINIGNVRNSVRVTFTHPKLIKEFTFAEKDFSVHKHAFTRQGLSLLAAGIVFSEGQEWKKKRRVISQIFNYDFITSITPRISEIFKESLLEIEADTKNDKKFEFDLINYTSHGTSRVVLDCFLGCEASQTQIEGQSLTNFVVNLIEDFLQVLFSPWIFFFGPKFFTLGLRKKDRDIAGRMKLFHNWGRSIIEEKMRRFESSSAMEQKSKDLIDALLLHNKRCIQSNNSEDVYSYEEILDEFKIFLIAGTDTTSHLLEMMIFYAIKHPEVEKRAREEVATFMENEDYSPENLKNFKYIDAIIKETTRIYGPANNIFLREVKRDILIDQIPIEKDTILCVYATCMHHSERYFKQPHDFRPERWLNGECDNLEPFVHVSFNAGPRSCIGRQLALFEAKIGMITILQRYQKLEILKDKLRMSIKFVYMPESFKINAYRAN